MECGLLYVRVTSIATKLCVAEKFREVPIFAVSRCGKPTSFDHLIGKRKHRWGNLNTQYLGGPQIKTEVEFGYLFDRNIADAFPFQNLVNKKCRTMPYCGKIRAV